MNIDKLVDNIYCNWKWFDEDCSYCGGKGHHQVYKPSEEVWIKHKCPKCKGKGTRIVFVRVNK